MKIVIANGRSEADYIIEMYNKKHNTLIVINDDHDFCLELSEKHKISVYFGKSTKYFDLDQAQIANADLFIALGNDDVYNYLSCRMAKQLFHVKKVIATVVNPNNVELFKRLGIDSCVSSSYSLGESIKSEASVEDLIKTLSLENDSITISEIEIKKNFTIVDKTLREIRFPYYMSVSCIYRSPQVIIPNGNTKILVGDRLCVVTKKEDQQKAIDLIQISNK